MQSTTENSPAGASNLSGNEILDKIISMYDFTPYIIHRNAGVIKDSTWHLFVNNDSNCQSKIFL